MSWVLGFGTALVSLTTLYIGYQMGRADTLEEWKNREIDAKNGWEEEALYWRYKLFGKGEEL